MSQPSTARILCKAHNKRHCVTFHADGTAFSACGDITSAAKRIAGTISLGKPLMEDNCSGLAALVLHGIPTVFQQPPLGEYVQWGAWKSLYTRFESNKLVEATVKREQRAMRKRDRDRAARA